MEGGLAYIVILAYFLQGEALALTTEAKEESFRILHISTHLICLKIRKLDFDESEYKLYILK